VSAFSPQELLDCAKREVRMRRRVYPRQVQDRKMSQEEADRELAMMEAIVAMLREKAHPGLF
jgi:hypothetical protein